MNNKNKSYIYLLLAVVGYWLCSHMWLLKCKPIFFIWVFRVVPPRSSLQYCVLKVHQIEAFYFTFSNISSRGGIPPDPLEDVTFTPQLKHVHTILNTFEAFLMYITYVNKFLFLQCIGLLQRFFIYSLYILLCIPWILY